VRPTVKAAGEDAAGPDALIVRTAWVYTAGGANFVRTMLRLMATRDSLGVVADQIGSPTWAPSLAATIWGLIDRRATGIFHHCDAGTASWYDFAVAIQEEALALGLLDRAVPIRPIATADYPTPARRPAFSLLDCSATRALLDDGHTHWRTNLRAMLKEEQALG
jgi:dTDP-4-dehydrorhamnose reductase